MLPWPCTLVHLESVTQFLCRIHSTNYQDLPGLSRKLLDSDTPATASLQYLLLTALTPATDAAAQSLESDSAQAPPQQTRCKQVTYKGFMYGSSKHFLRRKMRSATVILSMSTPQQQQHGPGTHTRRTSQVQRGCASSSDNLMTSNNSI